MHKLSQVDLTYFVIMLKMAKLTGLLSLVMLAHLYQCTGVKDELLGPLDHGLVSNLFSGLPMMTCSTLSPSSLTNLSRLVNLAIYSILTK